MAINFTELRELLGVISQSNITEFSLKSGDFEVSVRKDVMSGGVSVPPQAIAPPSSPVASTPVTSPEVPAPSPADQKWTAIVSPMVGTFYRAPAPDEPPFVEVGDAVSKGQGVCIIEAMKLMNEIEAEVAGQVMEIVVENGEPVEYGQTLMWIRP
ncbi:acetyl-CoA carboxylase biotin carboxyl carrier protein [Synechocystis sp. PCC 7339]|uniref:acetyl-CoA carboxylase biotin carboxyl carrier protein n=1 Tax=unclassified Synechocystis TaxID=2640012 RepID=UPI001BAFA39A|nr:MULTISPECIES: acetyl-CoA carboxylase biotin carboxyl carrier protein [unclassified Synechocystis]QUS60472.1 acetyl-CoA carboxylase biotin carboxyl carrier protein [Synechocystis sp. PCC 7338]UAJ72087.1 acetyl-CoA carboxylase biotin carboxyl carrier protein [Synechocystis sp. PCC 7339]